jgi:hypothetical protein
VQRWNHRRYIRCNRRYVGNKGDAVVESDRNTLTSHACGDVVGGAGISEERCAALVLITELRLGCITATCMSAHGLHFGTTMCFVLYHVCFSFWLSFSTQSIECLPALVTYRPLLKNPATRKKLEDVAFQRQGHNGGWSRAGHHPSLLPFQSV